MGNLVFSVLSAICTPVSYLFGCLWKDLERKERLRSDLALCHQEYETLEQKYNSLHQILLTNQERLESEVHRRDQKIRFTDRIVEQLRNHEQYMQSKIDKLQEQLSGELEGCGAYTDGSASPFLLDSAVKSLHASVSCFSKLFFDTFNIGLNLQTGHELRMHFNGAYLTRPAHLSYLLKAWACDVFFRDFENENFRCGGGNVTLDRNQRKAQSFKYYEQVMDTDSACDYLASDAVFAKFCLGKLLDFASLWQSSPLSKVITSGLDADCTSHSEEGSGAEQIGKLRMSFITVAKIVWALHKLCLSFEPRADIIRVDAGIDLNDEYMESVVSKDDDLKFIERVGLMIFPGFRLRRSIVKCQIYLAGSP